MQERKTQKHLERPGLPTLLGVSPPKQAWENQSGL